LIEIVFHKMLNFRILEIVYKGNKSPMYTHTTSCSLVPVTHTFALWAAPQHLSRTHAHCKLLLSTCHAHCRSCSSALVTHTFLLYELLLSICHTLVRTRYELLLSTCHTHMQTLYKLLLSSCHAHMLLYELLLGTCHAHMRAMHELLLSTCHACMRTMSCS